MAGGYCIGQIDYKLSLKEDYRKGIFISKHPQPFITSDRSILDSWDDGFKVLWSKLPPSVRTGAQRGSGLCNTFHSPTLLGAGFQHSVLPGTTRLLLWVRWKTGMSLWGVFPGAWGIPAVGQCGCDRETLGKPSPCACPCCTCEVTEAAGSLGPAGSLSLRSGQLVGQTVFSRDRGQTEQ